jgi:hypothetical protein
MSPKAAGATRAPLSIQHLAPASARLIITRDANSATRITQGRARLHSRALPTNNRASPSSVTQPQPILESTMAKRPDPRHKISGAEVD